MINIEEKSKEVSWRDQLNQERVERLYMWSLGNPMPPFKLVITPTDRCNLNCIFCPNYTARKLGRFKIENELKTEEWLDIVDQALKLDVKQWCLLGGGEPLLRSEILLPALEMIKSRMKIIDFELITNGILFSSELIKNIVEVAANKVEINPTSGTKKEIGVIQITISIHGLKDNYSFITGSSNGFDKVIENLKLFNKWKEKFNVQQPTIQINIVVNNKNFTQIPEMIKVFGELKVNQIALHPMRGFEETGTNIKNLELNNEQWAAIPNFVKEVRALTEKYDIALSTDPLNAHMKGPLNFNTNQSEIRRNGREEFSPIKLLALQCLEPWYDMLINPDGRVGRCASFVTRKEPVSVRSSNLKEIWYGEFFGEVRRNIIENKSMEGCIRCGLLSTTEIIKNHLGKFLEGKGIKVDK